MAACQVKGQLIGVNDMHIAAHARSAGLTPASSNLREFERVPGLLTESSVGEARLPKASNPRPLK